MTALRAAHPSLRSEQFLHGAVQILPGLQDVAWFDETAAPLASLNAPSRQVAPVRAETSAMIALAATIVPVLIMVAFLTLIGKDATGISFGTDESAFLQTGVT